MSDPRAIPGDYHELIDRYSEVDKEIQALEAETRDNLAPSKKTYAANIIRLDIAYLQRDVMLLAKGISDLDMSVLGIAEKQTTQQSLLDLFTTLLAGFTRRLKALAPESDARRDRL